jgi:uncharacterized MAPEG superfamily protein
MLMMQWLSVPATLLDCMAVAAILIYLPFLVVAYSRFQVGADLAAPRAAFDQLPAYAQRAAWAHQNGFESFVLFMAGALMAYITQVDSALAVGAAIAHVTARFLYSAFYILKLPLLRSLMFGVGSLCSATLIVLSLLQANF